MTRPNKIISFTNEKPSWEYLFSGLLNERTRTQVFPSVFAQKTEQCEREAWMAQQQILTKTEQCERGLIVYSHVSWEPADSGYIGVTRYGKWICH